MSTHARIRRGARVGAQVSLGLSVAALSLALGAGAAVATPAAPVANPDAATQTGDNDQTPKGTSSITGLVWQDVNHNALQNLGPDAEQPVAKVPVIVFFEGADETKIPEVVKKARTRGAVLPSKFRATFTDEKGVYTFDDLPAGKARVLVAPNVLDGLKPLAEQFRFTKTNVGDDDAVDSDFTQKLENVTKKFYFGEVAKVTLEADKKVVLDAGIIDPSVPANNGIACVQAFNDADRDGLRDKGEAPIAGLYVKVAGAKLTPAPAPAAQKLSLKKSVPTKGDERELPVTDEKGRYCFDGLQAGKYVAYIALGPLVLEDGRPVDITKEWDLTKKDVGDDDTIDSDFGLYNVPSEPEVADKAGVSDAFRVADDKTRTLDAGMFKDEPSPAPSTEPSTVPSTEPSPEPTDPLPTTGAAAGGILAAGGLLLAGGIALTVAARRRRRTAA